jgi:hypothetical protein
VLGLKINLSKSEILPIDDVGDVEVLASILGCRVASLPMTYSGLPLGSAYKASTIWNGIIEKMEHRLTGWKRLYLRMQVDFDKKYHFELINVLFVPFFYSCRSD